MTTTEYMRSRIMGISPESMTKGTSGMRNIISYSNNFRIFGIHLRRRWGLENYISNRVKLARMEWQQLTYVLCYQTEPTELKVKIYKTVIKPTMTYVAECWAVTKKTRTDSILFSSICFLAVLLNFCWMYATRCGLFDVFFYDYRKRKTYLTSLVM